MHQNGRPHVNYPGLRPDRSNGDFGRGFFGPRILTGILRGEGRKTPTRKPGLHNRGAVRYRAQMTAVGRRRHYRRSGQAGLCEGQSGSASGSNMFWKSPDNPGLFPARPYWGRAGFFFNPVRPGLQRGRNGDSSGFPTNPSAGRLRIFPVRRTSDRCFIADSAGNK